MKIVHPELTHDAQFSREEHAIEITDYFLNIHADLVSKLTVQVGFRYGMATYATHKLQVTPARNGATGTVAILFNSVFLYQDSNFFYKKCIPHQVAHVIAEIKALQEGIIIEKPHGIEWTHALISLISTADVPINPTMEFDSRSIKLVKGGIPLRCVCGGEDGFNVVVNSDNNQNKIKNGELTCVKCNSCYELVDDSMVSECVASEIKFIKAARSAAMKK
ncbi:MAG: hypothetical protein V3T17_06670 [Pseudomonadales bacterium]